MLRVNQLRSFGVLRPPPKFLQTDQRELAYPGSTVTFSAVNLGKPRPDRRIMFAFSGTNGSNNCFPSGSQTLGGQNLTFQNDDNGGNSRNGHVMVGYIDYPEGETANLVLNYSSGFHAVALVVARGYKLKNAGMFDFLVGTDPTMNIDIPERGIVLAAAATTAVNPSWGGVDEVADQSGEGGDHSTAAFRLYPNAATGQLISVSSGQSPSRYACVSFG